MNLPQFIKNSVVKLPDFRTRSRTGFWASDAGKDPVELYWDLTGEEPSDPTDATGIIRMGFGDAVERYFRDAWVSQMHLWGLHIVGSQIAVGGKNPDWQGYVDWLIKFREGDKFGPTQVLEFKTVWGYGADFMLRNMEPKDDHLYQLGLYLKDFYDKRGKAIPGCLFYFCISDANIGEMVAFDVEYAPATKLVRATRVCNTMGQDRPCNVVKDLNYVFKKWEYVLDCVQKKQIPTPEFEYKYDVTKKLLTDASDRDIIAVLEGRKVIGSWRTEYSKYKKKLIALSGKTPFYSADEMAMFEKEWAERHPRSKRFK